MTSTAQPPQPPRTPAPSWREAALARSEIITDAWEVTKTYAGRIAEWVLFLCMVMNIIEILVTLPLALSNIVLGTQVVMLDVGGFSPTSMGDHAREQGDERAARRASVTGYFLIAVTIVTLLLVTVGLLWSPTKPYTDMAEKGLILVRVVMTVIYAHVIHSLRRATTQRQHATFTEQLTELAERLTESEQRTDFRFNSPNTVSEPSANIWHSPKERTSGANSARPKLSVVEANTEHRIPKATKGPLFGHASPKHRTSATPTFSAKPANRV